MFANKKILNKTVIKVKPLSSISFQIFFNVVGHIYIKRLTSYVVIIINNFNTPNIHTMKTVKLLSYLFFIFFLRIVNAQKPGGIIPASTLWLKGNYSFSKMTFSSGNVVSGWRDEKSTYTLTQVSVPKHLHTA